MQTHPIFGDIKLVVEIDAETDCGKCIHDHVCSHSMHARCQNFEMGNTADMRHCQPCSHKYTRFDNRHPIPCFSCAEFRPIPI